MPAEHIRSKMTATENILIIEDDQSITDILTFSLRDAFYEVEVCRDGELELA